jgi:hypothetical protein
MRDNEARLCLSLRGCQHRRGLTDRQAIGPFVAGAIASGLFFLFILFAMWGY